MVYETYKKRGNKLCGPYYYESYRGKDGKVHKRYLGTTLPGKKKEKIRKNTYFLIASLIFLAILLSLSFFVQLKPQIFEENIFWKTKPGVTGMAFWEDGGDFVENRAMVVYKTDGNNYPQYCIFEGGGKTCGQTDESVTGNIKWTKLAADSNSHEMVMVVLTDANKIYAFIWDGTSWTNREEITSASGAGTYTSRVFDVEYDQQGRAIVVYRDNTDSSKPYYAIWDGSSWDKENQINMEMTENIELIELAADSNSNAMTAIIADADSSRDLSAIVWNGENWGDFKTLTTNGQNLDVIQDFDVEYDQQGKAVVMYVTASHIKEPTYIVWSGSSWGTATEYETPGGVYGDLRWMDLVADPNSNEMWLFIMDDEDWVYVLGWRECRPNLFGLFWDGTELNGEQAIEPCAYEMTEPITKSFDARYDQQGRVIIVYRVDNTPNQIACGCDNQDYEDRPEYQVWDGNSWSTGDLGRLGDPALWVELGADSFSKNMTVAILDEESTEDVEVFTWDGGGWSSMQNLEEYTDRDYNTIDVEYFGENPPEITSLVLNSSFGTDTTDENITAYTETFDENDDNVRVIYNWLKNDQPFGVLNMPFEANDGYESSETRDYALGNNGRVYSATWLKDEGKRGSTYSFDNYNDYINCGKSSVLNIREEITISAWIYPKGWGQHSYGYGRIVDKNMYALYLNGYPASYNDDSLVFIVYTGGTPKYANTPTDSISLDEWQHIAVTYNNEDVEIYINGEKQTLTYNGDPSGDIGDSSGNDLYIGNRYEGDRTFDGLIDEVKIYNRTLSEQQIKQLYNEDYNYLNTSTIVSQETELWDNWTVRAIPNDGFVDGKMNETNITIRLPNMPPYITSLILNSTYGTNKSDENITGYWQTEDVDDDNVNVIYNWYKNDEKIEILNLPFEGGSNLTFTKDYAYGNNASVVNATWNMTGGIRSGAYNFNGSECYGGIPFPLICNRSYIELENVLKYAKENFSVEVILKVNDNSAAGGIFTTNPVDKYKAGITALVTNYGAIELNLGWDNEYQRTIKTINDENWHHLLFVFEGFGNLNKTKIYIDGVLEASNMTRYSIPNRPYWWETNIGGDNLIIGKSEESTSSWSIVSVFNGTIDEFKVHNDSFSKAQVYQKYLEMENRLNSSTIVSEHLKQGDVWKIEAIPNDGFQDGEMNISNPITIENGRPFITSLILNSSEGFNTINENITAYGEADDKDNDNTTIIYNWLKNDQPFEVLNMPFEANDGYESSETRDYALGNNGTVNEATWQKEGVRGGCYEFDGIDDYIVLGNILKIKGNITLSAWINTSTNANRAIISKYVPAISGEFALETITDGIRLIIINSDDSEVQCEKNFNYHDNKWHYIVGTYNGTTMSVYVDGNFLGSCPQTGQIYQTGYALVVGASSMITRDFTGKIDEVKIYNASLSAEQVLQSYNDGMQNFTSSTIVKQETAKYDVWKVQAFPNDFSQDGFKREASIEILPTPHITIISPKNRTYFNRDSMEFKVKTNVPVEECKYSLDDADNIIMDDVGEGMWWSKWDYSMTVGGHRADFSCVDSEGYWGYRSVIFGIRNAPEITSLVLNSTYGTNYEFENLTAYTETENLGGTSIRSLYSWFKNSESITKLNTPFESIGGNENSNNKDYSFFEHIFNFYGDPVWNSNNGVWGGYYEFDGDGDYIMIGVWYNYPYGSPVVPGNLSRTYCAWAKPDQFNEGTVFSTGNIHYQAGDVALKTGLSSEKWRVYLDFDVYHEITIPGSSSGWHQFCFVHNGTGQKLYYDGDEKWSNTETLSSLWGVLYIGAIKKSEGVNGDFFDGSIDEVRFYSVAFSEEQIKQLYEEDTKYLNTSRIVDKELYAGDNWSVQATPSDETGYSDTVISDEIQINPSTKVVLYYPENMMETYERVITFQWFNISLAWPGIITYDIEVYDSPGLEPENRVRDASLILEQGLKTNYTFPELDFNKTYYWRVRAYNHDVPEYGIWSDVWNFTIPYALIIKLTQTPVNFGTMRIGERSEDDTADNSPLPVKMRNDGSVRIDVIVSGEYIWDTIDYPSEFFQYKIREDDFETGSFDTSLSTMSWENIDFDNRDVDIDTLNYTNTNDTALIDFRLEIPSETEPVGSKSSNIILYAQCAEC